MVDYGDVLFHPGNLWDYLDQTEKAASEILKSGTSILPAEETTVFLCPWFVPMAKPSGVIIADTLRCSLRCLCRNLSLSYRRHLGE